MNPIRRLRYDNPIRSTLRRVRHRLVGEPNIKTLFSCFSQAGEDRILWFLFQSLKIDCPTYIDVGAYRFDFCNNTYLFYVNGSRGVCIEPDPRLYSVLQANRQGDVCLNAAISYGSEEEVELFLFTDPSLNTLVEEEAKRRDEIGEYKKIDSIRVPALRLESVIEKYFSKLPDFISIDVEGADYDILANFDFSRYPVPVWVIETVEYSPTHIKPKLGNIQTLMESKGYFAYADTYINTCFVNTDWFYKHKVAD